MIRFQAKFSWMWKREVNFAIMTTEWQLASWDELVEQNIKILLTKTTWLLPNHQTNLIGRTISRPNEHRSNKFHQFSNKVLRYLTVTSSMQTASRKVVTKIRRRKRRDKASRDSNHLVRGGAGKSCVRLSIERCSWSGDIHPTETRSVAIIRSFEPMSCDC